MNNYQELLAPIEQIVRQAGDILMHYFRSDHLSSNSKAFGDLVTQADLESEKFLVDKLTKLLSQSKIYAEESGQSGAGDYCWVIDPLDGTVNFAHGLSYFCISVALTYFDKPVLACIYHPTENE